MTNLPPIDWANDDPAKMRQDYLRQRAELLPDMPADVRVAEECRTGLSGLHFYPSRETGAPILYFHGGSWMIGSPETHRVLCAMLARTTERRVISVPYRLAPEHPWPAQPEDAAARMKACEQHEGPVFVAGDSAGAAMALWADAAHPKGSLGVVGLYGAFGVVESGSLAVLGPEDGVLTAEGMRAIYRRLGLLDPSEIRSRFAPDGAPVCLIKAMADPLADDTDIVLTSLSQRAVTVIEAAGQPHAFLHNAARDTDALNIMQQIGAWMTEVEHSSARRLGGLEAPR